MRQKTDKSGRIESRVKNKKLAKEISSSKNKTITAIKEPTEKNLFERLAPKMSSKSSADVKVKLAIISCPTHLDD